MNQNSINLIGYLGKDAEFRYSPNGKGFTTFSIATNSTYTKQSTGEKVTHTEWHDCVVNGSRAESAAKLKKGQRVHVEGEIRSREYEKAGVQHRTYSVRVNSVTDLKAVAPDSDPGAEAPAPITAESPEVCILCKHIHTGRCLENAPNAQFSCACPGPCIHGKHPAWCEICAPFYGR